MAISKLIGSTIVMMGLLALVGLPAQATEYDIVLSGGRVMDPDTGLDAIRNVGIRDGRIEIITTDALDGARKLDASGLIVAPGFIDLHEHGQNEMSYSLMVRDGVTSAFELEVGTGDVTGWYDERKGGQIVNYGVSIGHIPVRMIVLEDPGNFLPSGAANTNAATEEQIADMARRLEEGLRQGAVAVGFGMAYTPGATVQEFEQMLAIAAQYNASSHIHVRGGVAGAKEAIIAAAKTGAPLHLVHANSSGGANTAEFLDLVVEARGHGQDVTTEAYPYSAGMTAIESALFDDWESWDDDRIQTVQWVATGERLTRQNFGSRRSEGGLVIIHSRTEAMTRTAIGHPLTMIASDGGLRDGRGHPRTSGSYSKILGKYVREEGLLGLMDALAKMTIMPAQRLEARVPAMARKGRISVGADADITIFDPGTIIDHSTYMDATIPSTGVTYVLIGGEVVVDTNGLVDGARPGRAIRAPAK